MSAEVELDPEEIDPRLKELSEFFVPAAMLSVISQLGPAIRVKRDLLEGVAESVKEKLMWVEIELNEPGGYYEFTMRKVKELEGAAN